jgi:hypothetical protein
MDTDKKEFIVKKGVLGMGLPVALLMSITAGFQVPGYIFQLQAFNVRTSLLFLLISLPIFLAAGFLWGVVVYKYKKHR